MRQIILDTETTGLSAENGDRIIEIGCVELVARKLTGNNRHYYVNPERPSSEEALRVHGISDEFLKDKPKFAQIADESDLVVLNRFEADATATGGKGFMDLVYPYATLKPLRELLRNRVQTGDGNEESDKVWREDLAIAVGDALIDIKVDMGHVKTTLHHLRTMKEGDLLFFKKPELAQLQAQGVPAFGVTVGNRGSSVAVRVEKQLVPGHI